MAGKKYEVYVQKGRPVWKIITGILFSHMGLFVLAIGYGAAGAYVFILLELPGKYLLCSGVFSTGATGAFTSL